MFLAYYVNYFNHHRIVMAEELYKLLGKDFIFIATMPRDPRQLKGGEDYSCRSYCLQAAENQENHYLAMKYAKEAEVCSFGAGALPYAIERAKHGRKDGISFETGERWLKKGWINILSPRLIKWWWTYQTVFRKRNFYKLCASAFAAADHEKLGTYRNRCYKWGYFTSVNEELPIKTIVKKNAESQVVKVIWCARYLQWKHPELPVLLAHKLKGKGYSFHIDMYGDEGNAAAHDAIYPKEKLKRLISELGVEDCVTLMGNRSNREIIQAMQDCAIFLFTSDQNEGWGAVANEAMSNGCALVAGDKIGSTPYLIRDGINGFMFKNCDVDSLTEKVEYLLNNPLKLQQMQVNAYKDMVTFWSPKVAAKNLLQLIEDLKNGRESSIEYGPCSKA